MLICKTCITMGGVSIFLSFLRGFSFISDARTFRKALLVEIWQVSVGIVSNSARVHKQGRSS